MVVVDAPSKATHFIPIQSTYGTTPIYNVFIKEIFQLDGAPKMIVSDRKPKFTSTFWRALFGSMGTKEKFNIAYYPQTDG